MTAKSLAILTLCFLCLLGSPLVAGETAPARPELSVSDLLKAYREKATLKGWKSDLEARATAQSAVDSRLSPGPWTLGLSGEQGLKPRSAQKLDLIAKKKIAFGTDKEAITRRYQREAEAELLAKQSEARDAELEVAKLFVKLRERQEAVVVNTETLAVLEPLEKKAGAAVRLGTLGGFFATRLKLTVDSVRSDLIHAKNAYAFEAKTLSEITGVSLSQDASAVKLIGRGTPSIETPQLSESNYLPAASSRARQEALAAQATQIGSAWEIEAGIGATHDFDTNERGILFQLDIPLGTASASQSEVQALMSEQTSLKSENQYELARAQERIKVLKTDLDRLSDALKIQESRVADLAAFLGKAQRAFRSGQGEIGEVIETSAELHEARVKRTELRSEAEIAYLSLDYFAGGDLL